VLVNADAPELRVVHRWLDSRAAGIGLIVVGMAHQRFYIGLGEHSAGRWVALFYRGSGGHELVTAAGTAYESMAWRTVQRAARAATEAGALQRRVALVTGAAALSNHYDHISGSLGLHVRPFAGVSFAPHKARIALAAGLPGIWNDYPARW
jgi:hypothetical protein